MIKLKADKKIFFNAGKISVGCVLSIIISAIAGLEYNVTAGLITVLSIQDTKKETALIVMKRFIAFITAVIISSVCFSLIGFNALAFGAYLFIFIIICYIFDWKVAIVPVSVLITHILAKETVNFSIIFNEFMLFFIGAGNGIILNLHLKKDKIRMNENREKLDNEIKQILERMSKRVLTDDKSDYNGECFKRLDRFMLEARKTAYENMNNSLKKDERYDIEYLEMRQEQCHILYEMYRNILKIETTPKQAKVISEFLKKISEEYHEKNDVKNLMNELDIIFTEMKKEKLPTQRSEFENRAVLYFLMLRIREFLSVKYEFTKRNKNEV